jgi:outer membrane receptor for ferrienterochelin and colicins
MMPESLGMIDLKCMPKGEQRRTLVPFFLMMLISLAVRTQCEVIVSSAEGVVPNAVLVLEGAALGATNTFGVWTGDWTGGAIEPPKQVKVQALGYEPWEGVLSCKTGETHTVVLEENTYMLGGATIVGSLSAMKLKESPIRTQVLSGKSLRDIPADDATEALDFSNGIRETIACGICGTNDIHINGLEGVYTLVLIDGVPLLGGLASAYALDGIPLSMIQQIEVIQGPASARFGSQAVGGVINVVLSPLRPGASSGSLGLDSHGRFTATSSTTWGREDAPWQLGLDAHRFAKRIDDNGDGMTDAPTIERFVGTVRHQRTAEKRHWRTTLRGFAEKRFGGAMEFTEEDRGTSNSYGERIDLLRGEWLLGGSPRDATGLTFQGGLSFHGQQSNYGLTAFDAREFTANAETFHSGWSWKENRRITGGMSLLWDNYQDETPADSDMNVWVPALYVEHTGSSNAGERGYKKFAWIHGLRIEKPSNAGIIFAPRINFKWSPSPTLDVRLNAGRGYRRVHLFTEEHAALDGSRAVLQPKQGLRPESSWNANMSFSKSTGDDTYSLTLSAHAFTTVFTDRIYADFDSLPNAIVYRNIDGIVWNRGVGSDVVFRGFKGWSCTAGATLLRSQLLEQSSSPWTLDAWELAEDIEFAPNFTSNLALGYTWNDWGFNIAGQHVGVMRLPFYNAAESEESDPFQLVHLSLFKSWAPKNPKRLGMANTLTIGVKNLTNTTQSRPILAPESPFGADFDASRIYGPIEQSRIFVKMAWSY